MQVLFSPQAQAEFEDAARYYDEQRQGLGDELRQEMRNFLSRLRQTPLSFPVEGGDIRRLILARFPYKLLYSVESDYIYVIAVAHRRRSPDYWIDRIDSP